MATIVTHSTPNPDVEIEKKTQDALSELREWFGGSGKDFMRHPEVVLRDLAQWIQMRS